MTRAYYPGERLIYAGLTLIVVTGAGVVWPWAGVIVGSLIAVGVVALLWRCSKPAAIAVGAIGVAGIIATLVLTAGGSDVVRYERTPVDLGGHQVPVRLSDGRLVLLDPVGER